MYIQEIYAILTLSMLICLYKSGKRLACMQGDSFMTALKTSWLAIVAFTLNEGLRFGRGIDYNIYGRGFEYFDFSAEMVNPGFALIQQAAKLMNTGWASIVFFASFLMIISVIAFMRHFKECAPWALPLFCILLDTFTQNLVKWFIAFSCILIGFSYYVNNEKDKHNLIIFLACSLLATTIHFGIILIPFAYYLLSKFDKPICKPFFAVVVFFVIGFMMDTSVMSVLIPYLSVFEMIGGDKASAYISDAEKWLTSGSDVLVLKSFPPLYYIPIYISIVYAGYYINKIINKKRYTILYNLYLLGFMIMPLANQIELAKRYNILLYFFFFVILSYIIYYRYELKRCMWLYRFTQFSLVLLVAYYLSTFVRGEDFMKLYVWDSNGRNYLDINLYYDMMMKKK